VELITYDEPPINKPHGLNIGLAAATGDVVTIFDAEDEPHLDILNLANTIMRHEDVPVVQSGIQLMNYGDHWYSALNVLEYFFWFKSRMHYHATLGIVPLGGNTIFIRRDLIQELGGWDQSCLTEDADLGIRMSVAGVPIHVIYDDRYVTQEETPTTVSQFIRQRTRWDQGFLQVLLKWEWLHLPHWNQRALAFYTLAFPFLQAITLVYFPISVWLMFFKKLPVLLAMISLLPLYALVIQFVVSILGLYEFTSTHEIRASRMSTVRMLVAFMPYQWLLGVAAVRAVWRQVLSVNTWEKTSHAGAHRPEHPSVGALPSLIRQNEENAIHD
jgi:cellulose synthase/poly-beta-1,6-N-acetylglucosamine synthase-like glycosyltransferase